MQSSDKDGTHQPTEDIERTADPPTTAKDNVIATNEPFSIYTLNQKRLMVLFAATAAFFSPVTATIYLPALSSVAEDLHVSYGKITLTVTTYLVSTSYYWDAPGRKYLYLSGSGKSKLNTMILRDIRIQMIRPSDVACTYRKRQRGCSHLNPCTWSFARA